MTSSEMAKMRTIWMLFAFPFLVGCSVMKTLDFGGVDEKPFEARFAWQKRFETSKADPGKIDDKGVYQPETPEVEAALQFPDIHAGMSVVIQPKPRITPTVNVEIVEFKVPVLRWFSVQVGAGNQLAEIYLGKRLVSVFEITAGPWVGYDFEEHDRSWGVAATLIRF